MHYVVYVDDARKRARVHRSICCYYVNRKRETLDDNRWHDASYSREEAFRKMREVTNTDWSDVGKCQCCNP